MNRVEVITRVEREAEKAAVLAENVAAVARKHGIARSVVYNWRSARRAQAIAAMPGAGPVEFIPIGVIGGDQRAVSAERTLRGLALGRKAWLFAGSDRGAQRAAVMFTLIITAKLNDINPQSWLADVFTRIASHRPACTNSCLGTGRGSRPQPRWPPEPKLT